MMGKQGGYGDKEAEGGGKQGDPNTTGKQGHVRPASQGGKALKHFYHAQNRAEKPEKRGCGGD
jgi:hypothetical protein